MITFKDIVNINIRQALLTELGTRDRIHDTAERVIMNYTELCFIQNESTKIISISVFFMSNNVAYYYENANIVYGQYNVSIYLSILFPVFRKGNYHMYTIDQFLIPVIKEINNTDANILTKKLIRNKIRPNLIYLDSNTILAYMHVNRVFKR